MTDAEKREIIKSKIMSIEHDWEYNGVIASLKVYGRLLHETMLNDNDIHEHLAKILIVSNYLEEDEYEDED